MFINKNKSSKVHYGFYHRRWERVKENGSYRSKMNDRVKINILDMALRAAHSRPSSSSSLTSTLRNPSGHPSRGSCLRAPHLPVHALAVLISHYHIVPCHVLLILLIFLLRTQGLCLQKDFLNYLHLLHWTILQIS